MEHNSVGSSQEVSKRVMSDPIKECRDLFLSLLFFFNVELVCNIPQVNLTNCK